MKNLVIVESPTKAKTLGQFLSKDYEILASMGHVRDLPRGEFGVDVENNFAPKYVIPKEKIKSVNAMVKEATGAENLWLATDPDREGEAIAWNLLQVIKQKSAKSPKDYQRVVFHEITKDAVLDAFSHARKIDQDLVEAQQSRRILDRLVGYKLSPLLWKKIKSKLSAGRVQSVALRLVVDREREIEAFKKEEYWEIWVELSKEVEGSKARDVSDGFEARLIKVEDKKAEIKNKKQAEEIVTALGSAKYKVADIQTRDVGKAPSPPFTTSTLQQAASSKFGFVPKRTMSIAQNLYEKGLITYMRTDSVNLSQKAIEATRSFIKEKFGEKYLSQTPRIYKVKSKLAQEAHEAIRPTNMKVTGDQLPLSENDNKKLYDLIWRRTLACQMPDAVVLETSVDILSTNGKTFGFRAGGQIIKFDGYFKAWEKPPVAEQTLPKLENGQDLTLLKVNPQQKFTEPPSRYSEATLIRDLEKHGIGRPSTYAPTISTLYDRFYIERLEGRKIAPTPIGKITVDFLVKYFSNIVDLSFTAQMEDNLDDVAQGKVAMAPILEKFWKPFEKQVDKVQEEAEKVKIEVEKVDEKCDKCGKDMVVRYGRFGKFLACSGFPDCKNTKPLNQETGIICPTDGGNVVMRKTKKGRIFWGCSNWPKCEFASWTKPATTEDTKSEIGETEIKKISPATS